MQIADMGRYDGGRGKKNTISAIQDRHLDFFFRKKRKKKLTSFMDDPVDIGK